MFTCPVCQKSWETKAPVCPRCAADLSLLVDVMNGCEEGLARADSHLRAGELSEAVMAYLQVLEVDPDNPMARRQVSQVVTAVRQFDRRAQRPLWLHWRWAWPMVGIVIAFVLGYIVGRYVG